MNTEEMEKQLVDEIALRDAAQVIVDKAQAIVDSYIVTVAKLELDLAEAEKAELRHGDFGANDRQRWIKLNDTIHWLHEDRWSETAGLSGETCLHERKGNIGQILDDLTALSEPLYTFTADVHHYGFDFKNFPQAPIQIAGNWHALAEAKGISMKIQRVIFTAEQEAAKATTKSA